MKRQHFTLMEVLIAIGIVVVLATLITGASKHAIKKAQMTKCRAQMSALEFALNQYYDTYHVWPGTIYNKNMDTNTANGHLIYQMRDIWTTSAKDGSEQVSNNKDEIYYFGLISRLQGHNTRKKSFLSVQNNAEGDFADPWGNNFTIYVSRKHNGKIALKDSEGTDSVIGLAIDENTDNKQIFFGNVLIVSKGPDGEWDEDDLDADENEDNIYSVSTHWIDGVGHEIAE